MRLISPPSERAGWPRRGSLVLRFVLDNNVDVRVCRALAKLGGHDCWPAPQQLEQDDDVSIYADDKGAAVVTHDVEFTYRRQRRTFGQHVRLMCTEPEAVKVVELHHDELIRQMTASPVGVFVVSWSRVEFKPPRWE